MNKTIARFADGPLEGEEHSLPQVPVMLRVAVHLGTNERRCLMGWEFPDANSEIVFYIAGCLSTGFWDGRDHATGRRIGGTMMSALYHILRADLRPNCGAEQDPATWRAWCEANRGVLTDEHYRLRDDDVAKAREQRRGAAEGAS